MADEEVMELADRHDDFTEELDTTLESDTGEDGDSDDDLAEAAKGPLLRYTIINNGIESTPTKKDICVEAIQEEVSSIGASTATLIQRGDKVKLYKCSACDEVFKTELALSEHALKHIDADMCNSCGRAFDSKKALRIHKTHCMKEGSRLGEEESGLFPCGLCDRVFKYKSTLVNHKRTFHAEKCYVCCLCEKGFPTSHDLVRHSYTHSSTKPFLCEEPGCKKGFTCRSSLNKHIRLKHQIEKIYRCSTCSKTFQMECDIQRHMFTHTKIRPFKCTICAKTYTCKSSLKQHINLIHCSKTLACVFCAKTFRLQQDLERHTATHTGSKRWRCSICHKTYSCKSSLAVHKKNVHEELHVSNDEKMDENWFINNRARSLDIDLNDEIISAESDEQEAVVSKPKSYSKRKLAVGGNFGTVSKEEGKGRKRKLRKSKNPRKVKKSLPSDEAFSDTDE